MSSKRDKRAWDWENMDKLIERARRVCDGCESRLGKKLRDSNWESVRLKTFYGHCPWKKKSYNPLDFARTGFRFIGGQDKVQCVFCGVVLYNWGLDWESAEEVHRKFSPGCPFLCGEEVGNRSVWEKGPMSAMERIINAIRKWFASPAEEPEYIGKGVKDWSESTKNITWRQDEDGNMYVHCCEDRLFTCRICWTRQKKNVDLQKMKHEYARLETFYKPQMWSRLVSPLALARNGFRYLGEKDKVKCVYCGVNLMNWKDDDDPAREHRRYSPRCPFVCKLPMGNVPIGNI